jgi:hypothetical protein
MNPCPASPAFSTAPKITNTATTDTDTPVSCAPQAAFGNDQRAEKALHRRAGMAKFAGNVLTNRPYTSASTAISGSGQPIARRAISRRRPEPATMRNLQIALQRTVLVIQRAMRCGQPDANRNAAGTEHPTKPARYQPALEANMIHGTASAMCSGRETRFGTSPEKISQR